jgi:hypothetical protein
MLATCALALPACSCGAGAPPPHARAHIRATIVTFMRELAAGNGKVACEGLTAAGQNSAIGAIGPELANFGIFTCAQTVQVTGAQLSAKLRRELLAVRVGSISLSGTHASVRWSQITSPGGAGAAVFRRHAAVRLLYSDDFWLIDSL